MQDIRIIFSKVPDPRVEGRCLHLLSDILFIALCTLLSKGEDFEDMVAFAEEREDWLRTKIELSNGIPSHDTFNRVFQIIDSKHLTKVLGQDGANLLDHLEGQLINIDGKKLRGVSPGTKGNEGLFILSAWVSEQEFCLGQQVVDNKSNEIFSIPDLLDEIEVKGSTISLDAMGTQTEIAKKIIKKKADYLLALKQNQEGLFEEVQEAFVAFSGQQYLDKWESDHGRIERRACHVLEAKEVLGPKHLRLWPKLSALIKVNSSRIIQGIETSKTRLYISSRADLSAQEYNQMIRSHWSIENKLHWHLDVTFGEDASRARTKNAPENLNVFRKLALRRVAKDDSKLSKRKRLFKASMNIQYLDKLLRL
jgi:predicted transposase YbfD/YdcC